MTLAPDPHDLYIASPCLGPWFDREVTLQTCDPVTLAQRITSSGTSLGFQPPVTSLLTLLVSGDDVKELTRFRDGIGNRCFPKGNLIALLRIFPEVEARLHGLTRHLPALDGTPGVGAAPRRARIRHLALDVGKPTIATVDALVKLALPIDKLTPGVGPPDPVIEAALASVGLEYDPATQTARNGEHPMFELRDVLSANWMRLPTGTVNLWAFDDHDRAVDPGAVVAWWKRLADSFASLKAGVTTMPTTMPATVGARTVHLVNAHGGWLTSELFDAIGKTGFAAPIATARTLQLGNAAAWSLQAPAASDAFPAVRLAAWPVGSYAEQVAIAGTGMLDRDFVRVAAVDVEAHLVGQRRIARTRELPPPPAPELGGPPRPTDLGPSAGDERRAAMQARESTRVRTARFASDSPFLATSDAIAKELVTLAGSAGFGLVAGAVDLAAGYRGDILPTTDRLVAATAKVTAHEVHGVGADAVLLVLSLEGVDPTPGPVWVRAWHTRIDLATGGRYRGDGGAGRAFDDGGVTKAYVVIRRPSGDGATQHGVDLMIVTPGGAQMIGDELRFGWPAGGAAPIAFAAATDVVWCERGKRQRTLFDRPGSGDTVIAKVGEEWALVDTPALASGLDPKTLGGALADTTQAIALTPPIWGRDGTLQPTAGAIGRAAGWQNVAIVKTDRASLVAPNLPKSVQERLEVVAAVPGAAGRAVIGSTPLYAHAHELGAHRIAHPGAPAAVEIHGAGVALAGNAAELVRELVRERTAGMQTTFTVGTAINWQPGSPPPGSTAWLAVEAGIDSTRPKPAAGGERHWAAVLRTGASGTEGEPLLPALLAKAGSFPLSELLTAPGEIPTANVPAEIESLLRSINTAITEASRSAIGAFAEIVRALDRRILAGAYGMQEGARSIAAAIRNAEDFIYIETPAIDDCTIENCHGEPDPLRLVKLLEERLKERPALRLILCVPLRLVPGTPPALENVRNALLDKVRLQLTALFPKRVVVFHPAAGGNRSLRLASTSVIVDDVYAFVGTTHLWRRGATFDSSVGAAVFDEKVAGDRCESIRAFRRQLVAAALGLRSSQVPECAAELVRAIEDLLAHDGGNRVMTAALPMPLPFPWDSGQISLEVASTYLVPDGSASTTLADLATRLTNVNVPPIVTPP